MTGHTWQFDPRPQVIAPIKRRTFRWTLASIIGLIASLALSTTTLAGPLQGEWSCQGKYTTYHASGDSPYWYAQLQTGNPYVYETLGAKGNLTTGGNPSTFAPATQHVDSYVSTYSTTGNSTQIGWGTGVFGQCGTPVQTSGIYVYVEIYDDSTTNNCYAAMFGTAPSNASYDARYYGIDSGKYQYRAYYQAPGSPTIQYLGWGDYNQQYTAEVAAGEVMAKPVGGVAPKCPVLGDTLNGHWNLLGNPNSNTFAGYLQLYTGSSWVDWTSNLHQSVRTSDDPYQIQSVSDDREIETGGGQE